MTSGIRAHGLDDSNEVMSPFWTVQRLRAGNPESSRFGPELDLRGISASELDRCLDTRIGQSRDFVGTKSRYLIEIVLSYRFR
jgi:hypothetical protein